MRPKSLQQLVGPSLHSIPHTGTVPYVQLVLCFFRYFFLPIWATVYLQYYCSRTSTPLLICWQGTKRGRKKFCCSKLRAKRSIIPLLSSLHPFLDNVVALSANPTLQYLILLPLSRRVPYHFITVLGYLLPAAFSPQECAALVCFHLPLLLYFALFHYY